MSQLTKGQRFKALSGTPSGDVTIGREYVCAGVDHVGEAYFIDDSGEANFAICDGRDVGGVGVLYPDGYEVLS